MTDKTPVFVFLQFLHLGAKYTDLKPFTGGRHSLRPVVVQGQNGCLKDKSITSQIVIIF